MHAGAWSIGRNEQSTRSSRAHEAGAPNHGVVVPEVHGTRQNHGSDSDFVQIANHYSCELFSLVFTSCSNAMLWGDSNERLFLVSFRGPP